MKKNLTEIVFILDRSGSLAGLEADTIREVRSRLPGRNGSRKISRKETKHGVT